MEKKTVLVKVSVNVELPEKEGFYFGYYTDGMQGYVRFIKTQVSSYFQNHKPVAYWMKEEEVFILTEDELRVYKEQANELAELRKQAEKFNVLLDNRYNEGYNDGIKLK